MNKFFTALSIILVIFTSAFAQKSQPKLGKIDKADLLMKECDYDKDAVAFKLIDWGSIHYDRGSKEDMVFKTVFQKRERIKILQQEGLSYANITIPIYTKDNAERITKLDAYVYTIDETGKIDITSINKNTAYTKKINSFYTQLIIPFPKVKVGSVIEYKYTLERETMTNIKNWNFQDDIPVRYSEYELTIPLVFKFSVQPSIIDSVEVKEEVFDEILSGNHGVVKAKLLHKNFIMRNLKALPQEPFMGAQKDYQQRLAFQLSQIDYGNGDIADLQTSWKDVLKNLHDDEDFGKQFEQYINKAEWFVNEVKNKTTDEQKLAFAYNYFQKNFTWNEQESIYTHQGVKQTWDAKVGSTGDINLLFIKLLKDAGLNASPILFSTRNNGTVNIYTPFITQFNTVLCAAIINKNTIIIDATNQLQNYSILPEKINNTNGFIIEDTASHWMLATNANSHYKVITAHNGMIDENGVLKGESIVIAEGYARTQRIEAWLHDKSQFEQKYFGNKSTTIYLNDLTLSDIDDNTKPLEQKAKYTYTINTTGAYNYFTTNFFTDFVANPFIKDERVTDIDFGYLQDYQIFANLTLAPNFVFEQLPKNLSLVMPDKSITFNRFVEAEDNVLSIKISINFKKTTYSASVYPAFKEFYKQLFENLNEQIIIKKK
jgi:Domain of Unknown Function with PDB structure (DUF3857)